MSEGVRERGSEAVALCVELQEAIDAQSEINLHTGAMLTYVEPEFFARLAAVAGAAGEGVRERGSGGVGKARAPKPEMEFPECDLAPVGECVSSVAFPEAHLLGASPAAGSVVHLSPTLSPRGGADRRDA